MSGYTVVALELYLKYSKLRARKVNRISDSLSISCSPQPEQESLPVRITLSSGWEARLVIEAGQGLTHTPDFTSAMLTVRS